ncbi:hypothetical protein STEG23_011720, partial [Scotinomys teguina]
DPTILDLQDLSLHMLQQIIDGADVGDSLIVVDISPMGLLRENPELLYSVGRCRVSPFIWEVSSGQDWVLAQCVPTVLKGVHEYIRGQSVYSTSTVPISEENSLLPFLHCGIMQEELDYKAKVHSGASHSAHIKTFSQCEMAVLVAKQSSLLDLLLF